MHPSINPWHAHTCSTLHCSPVTHACMHIHTQHTTVSSHTCMCARPTHFSSHTRMHAHTHSLLNHILLQSHTHAYINKLCMPLLDHILLQSQHAHTHTIRTRTIIVQQTCYGSNHTHRAVVHTEGGPLGFPPQKKGLYGRTF